VRPSAYRILCVDDAADSRDMLKVLFETRGYAVVCAGGTGEAVRLAEATRFDLYVLDSRLPDGAGTSLCERLKVVSPDTPIIFYSGAASDDDRRAALVLGATAYVIKPYVDQLIAEVCRLLPDARPS
jgi:DNA-binding response OmpR family regulator